MPTTNKPKFDAAKFRELMLYAAEKSSGDQYYGATKLNKILFFADFLSFGLTGAAITGATYMRRENGPAPLQLKPMEREIENAEDGMFVNRRFFNKTQRRLIPKRRANIARFTPEEIDLVDDVIGALSDYSADAVSQLSHERSYAWQVAEPGEEIPYSAVFLSARRATSRDIERGKELARKFGWQEPSTAS